MCLSLALADPEASYRARVPTRPMELKLTMESVADEGVDGVHGADRAPLVPSLHVDTNNGAAYRCCTVIAYLNDVQSGAGGETRFPLANAPRESPLRASAEAALGAGATVLRRGASCHADALLDAAESSNAGVHVRPRHGAAIVFWTMDEHGVDAGSWHNGARVAAHGGGKWIVQKFKELPTAHRHRGGAGPPALPAALRPPATPTHQRGESQVMEQ